ncbi:hypothetical protein VF10_38325 [Nostoc linckia z13]|nr:hypothetical protein VF10_38325 [Nostoc linckia z13]
MAKAVMEIKMTTKETREAVGKMNRSTWAAKTGSQDIMTKVMTAAEAVCSLREWEAEVMK